MMHHIWLLVPPLALMCNVVMMYVQCSLHTVHVHYGPRREKTCLRRGLANNTGTDQPAHPRSLISTFVIRFLESIICKHTTGEIAIF